MTGRRAHLQPDPHPEYFVPDPTHRASRLLLAVPLIGTDHVPAVGTEKPPLGSVPHRSPERTSEGPRLADERLKDGSAEPPGLPFGTSSGSPKGLHNTTR